MDNFFAGLVTALLTFAAIGIVWIILEIVAKWSIFRKMDEPGWKSLIPFYSEYIVYKHCWNWQAFAVFIVASFAAAYFKSGDMADSYEYIATLCSMVAFVVAFLENIKLSRSFGHGYLFAFGLLILNPIFTMILGFGSSEYIGNTTEQ